MTLVWQGIHICSDSFCQSCADEYLCDLPAGQGLITPHILDKKTLSISNPPIGGENWFTLSLKKICKLPINIPDSIEIEKFREMKKVILLSAVDFIHGHCVARLFNAQKHLELNPEFGLIVIIQPFLRWMVPKGVAEIWTLSLPMSMGTSKYTTLPGGHLLPPSGGAF